MKFKVYEVVLDWATEKDGDIESYLYVDYKDAKKKFDELVKKQKQVDWIQEGWSLLGKNEAFTLINHIDFWGFYAEKFWSDWKSEITIIEREVF